ncbi:ankyrin [Xylaria arbuscula]|nr:ankyrin [Xylaria arbuscula]
MPLFDLPNELLELVFEQFIASRRRFKYYIDRSVFRLRSLRKLSFNIPRWTTQYRADQSLPYIHSYLMYQILRAEPTTASKFGRIRLVSRILNESDDDLECLSSLVSLAAHWNIMHLLKDRHICEKDDIEADVFVAAAYLGREDYVAHLIAKGVPSYESTNADPFRSVVFGFALRAATLKGNLGIIKLLLTRIPQYRSAGSIPRHVLALILDDSSIHKHQPHICDDAVFSFGLGVLDETRKRSGNEGWICDCLVRALRFASSPTRFEQIAARLPLSYNLHQQNLTGLLLDSAEDGNIEMVSFLLKKGISRAPIRVTPRDRAVSNVAILRMLLGCDSDPIFQQSFMRSALTTAVSRGRISMVKVLLDHGANLNHSFPSPIALAIFKENLDMFQLLRYNGARLDTSETGGVAMKLAEIDGLSSMQDVLVREGVKLNAPVESGLWDKVLTNMKL